MARFAKVLHRFQQQGSLHRRAVSAAAACRVLFKADLNKAVGNCWRDVHRLLEALVGCLGVAQAQVLGCPPLGLIAAPAKVRLLTL